MKYASTWSVKGEEWQSCLQGIVGYGARVINLIWLLRVLSQGQCVILPQHTCSRIELQCSNELFKPTSAFPYQQTPKHPAPPAPQKCSGNCIFPQIKIKESIWSKLHSPSSCNLFLGQLLAPLDIRMSLKYIPTHIHNYEHSRVIMNMKWSSHGFLFHRNINSRENKAHIFWKNKEYISDVQQKIIELHKLVKWL